MDDETTATDPNVDAPVEGDAPDVDVDADGPVDDDAEAEIPQTIDELFGHLGEGRRFGKIAQVLCVARIAGLALGSNKERKNLHDRFKIHAAYLKPWMDKSWGLDERSQALVDYCVQNTTPDDDGQVLSSYQQLIEDLIDDLKCLAVIAGTGFNMKEPYQGGKARPGTEWMFELLAASQKIGEDGKTAKARLFAETGLSA